MTRAMTRALILAALILLVGCASPDSGQNGQVGAGAFEFWVMWF